MSSHVSTVLSLGRQGHRSVQMAFKCPQESGVARHLTLIPMSVAIIHHLLPKKLKPMGRLPLLPPSLSVARERFRLDERLERFEERLRLLERFDDRDDGMPYTHDAENNFGDNRPGADDVINRVDDMSTRSKEGWRSPHFLGVKEIEQYSQAEHPSPVQMTVHISQCCSIVILLRSKPGCTRRM